MKKAENNDMKLKYEEMEEVEEFSFGSIGIAMFSVVAILILLGQFLF